MIIGWKYEGVAWNSPTKSAVPVYRLFNKWSGDHHYTTDVNEYNDLGDTEWTKEDICFYSDESKGIPVYRLFNRYTVIGTHQYTTSKNEYDNLPNNGWKQEGICFYGMKH